MPRGKMYQLRIFFSCIWIFENIQQESNLVKGIIQFLSLGLVNNARLAQTVERGTFNPEVEGSSPSSGVGCI